MKRFKELFHRMGSPRFFYFGARWWVFGCYTVGAVSVLTGSIYGLWFVPPDYLQGDSFRIMYIHVPTAHLSQLIYIAIAIAGFVYVVWRMKMADVFIHAAAPVGASLTALALFSGIVWGIPTWGTGWVWDARTTSMLVQLFLFVAVIVLRQVSQNPQFAAIAVSIMAMIGVVNIPIIKYSVEWFSTLHQPASIQIGKEISIDTSMLWPLLINTIGFYALFAGIVLAHMRNVVFRREKHSAWVATIRRGR